MSMDLTGLGAVFDFGGKLLDKLIPDPVAREAAKLELLRQQQAGELTELQTRLSAIVAEAQSADPWTSRARPSMLYVWYVLLLCSIPMGILAAFAPEIAARIAAGATAWMNAIPEPIVNSATIVLLGYVGSRGYEKVKGAA